MMKMTDVRGPVLAEGLEALRACYSQFGQVDLRESFDGSPHHDTQTIYLRATPWPLGSVSELQQDLRVVNWPTLQLDTRWQTVLMALQEVSGLVMARAMIVRLTPDGAVDEHKDEGLYAESTERFHWVLSTNDRSICTVGGVDYAPQVGELWWFDKSQLHSASNAGSSDRVHLIFDGWRKL